MRALGEVLTWRNWALGGHGGEAPGGAGGGGGDGTARRRPEHTAALSDLLVSAARDLVQATVRRRGTGAMRATAKLTALPEHLLLTGKPVQAVDLLVRARGVAVRRASPGWKAGD